MVVWEDYSLTQMRTHCCQNWPGVRPRHFSTTCTVPTKDCKSWWLSGCHSSVAEHWLRKPGVLSLISSDCQPSLFIVLYFAAKKSKLSLSQLKQEFWQTEKNTLLSLCSSISLFNQGARRGVACAESRPQHSESTYAISPLWPQKNAHVWERTGGTCGWVGI